MVEDEGPLEEKVEKLECEKCRKPITKKIWQGTERPMDRIRPN